MTPAASPLDIYTDTDILVICGHYGCGKTNLALNLAYQLAASRPVSLIDLDIVNPYFRSSESDAALEAAGIDVVSSSLAHSTLDIPALSPAISARIGQAARGETCAIIDVGGDPEGATAFGRFADQVAGSSYEMVYVVNQQRLMTHTPTEALGLLYEIEEATHLRATGIVANTHLKWETNPTTIREGIPYAHAVAEAAGLPLHLICVPAPLFEESATLLDASDRARLFPCEIYVRTPWEADETF
jgi:hypothetical protein